VSASWRKQAILLIDPSRLRREGAISSGLSCTYNGSAIRTPERLQKPKSKGAGIMASQSRPEIPGSFRFEFDATNRILLVRVEGG
jgi:hypothetical protein